MTEQRYACFNAMRWRIYAILVLAYLLVFFTAWRRWRSPLI